MKNIVYGAGVVSVLTTLVTVLLGKVDLSTGIMVNTAFLSLLYGIIQKIENNSTKEENSLLSLELDYEKKNKADILKEVIFLQTTTLDLHSKNAELENKLKASTEILPVLKELVEDSIKEPVKKTRTRKVKVDKK